MKEDTEDCVAKFTSLVRIGPGEWLSFQLFTSKLFWSWAIAFGIHFQIQSGEWLSSGCITSNNSGSWQHPHSINLKINWKTLGWSSQQISCKTPTTTNYMLHVRFKTWKTIRKSIQRGSSSHRTNEFRYFEVDKTKFIETPNDNHSPGPVIWDTQSSIVTATREAELPI